MEVHVLASGSDGNCTVIRGEESAIMIDAGLSRKRILELMAINGIDDSEIKGILVTHEHSDHVTGVGPLARKIGCPVYCNDSTFAAFKAGKVDHVSIPAGCGFGIDDFSIMPMSTSHDAVDPVSYRVEENGKVAVVATDTGTLPFPVRQALSEADIAVVESNYDRRMLMEGPYPYRLKMLIDSDHGHMSNYLCADVLKKTMHDGMQIFLAHMSKTNNTPDVAKDTVSKITGLRRSSLDCLDPEFADDTRILRT